jgi:DNA-binding NarL/FixJ family response regulator
MKQTLGALSRRAAQEPDHVPYPPHLTDLSATEPIRLAIVDDHPVVREGTAALLAGQPDLVVAATGGTVPEARTLLRRDDLDVLLLDIRLGSDSGLGALDRGQRTTGSAVIVLTAYDYPQYARAALELGAAGFVTKTAPLAELLTAIRRVAAGGLAFSVRPAITAAVSARELEVIRLVVDGRTNDEIAGALGLSAKTVETHLRRLFERFGVGSRTELATRALRGGWLEVPPTG